LGFDQCGSKRLEEPGSGGGPASDDAEPKSPSSSLVVEKMSVLNGTGESGVELSNSVAATADQDGKDAVVSDHISSNYEVANHGLETASQDDKVSLPCSTEEKLRNDGSTGTDISTQFPQHLRVQSTADGSNDGSVVKLHTTSDLHRDSDLLLSARRTSIDYFQKVTY